MKLAAAYLSAMLMTGPAVAQDSDILAACAAAAIGSPECDAEALSEALGVLSAGDVRVFASYGMESFAMLTALRYASSAIYFASEGEGCVAEEERTAAIEIWSIGVRLPDDAPEVVAERFAVFDGIMDNIVQMEVAC